MHQQLLCRRVWVNLSCDHAVHHSRQIGGREILFQLAQQRLAQGRFKFGLDACAAAHFTFAAFDQVRLVARDGFYYLSYAFAL